MLAHILLMIAIALVVMFVSLLLLWLIAGMPRASDLTDKIALLDMIRISLLVAGGIGGIVALVVAYRRQHLGERAEPREVSAHLREEAKLFNERFASASEQLGGANIMVRLAGVYAISNLADDWVDKRQMCIDVLCAYVRKRFDPPVEPQRPSTPMPTSLADPREMRRFQQRVSIRANEVGRSSIDEEFDDALAEFERERTRFEADKENYHLEMNRFQTELEHYHRGLEERQVRATALRVIQEHLAEDAKIGWHQYNFDFTGGIIEDINFSDIVLTQGQIRFNQAIFEDGNIDLTAMKLSGSSLLFEESVFNGCKMVATHIKLEDSLMSFDSSVFNRTTMNFDRPYFIASGMSLEESVFNRSQIEFAHSNFVHSNFSMRNVVVNDGAFKMHDTLRFLNGSWTLDDVTVNEGEFDLDLGSVSAAEDSDLDSQTGDDGAT